MQRAESAMLRRCVLSALSVQPRSPQPAALVCLIALFTWTPFLEGLSEVLVFNLAPFAV